MREIGGYLELDKYKLPMLHDEALALNCGRNALAYLIRSKQIKKIRIPKFLCDSVEQVCIREGIFVTYYSVTNNFLPEEMILDNDEWLYVVNYYGQLKNEIILKLAQIHKRIIVDHAQAYFQMPLNGIDTLYTCRKFFGVADGAFLYTDTKLNEEVLQDESFDRMGFVLGRFEKPASVFYAQAAANNDFFTAEPIKLMSKLTNNLLHGIDYLSVKQIRTENFLILHNAFNKVNALQLEIPEGAFMYPLYLENGTAIRKLLQSKKIYIPTLWPNVIEECGENTVEADMAKNILPIPVDQRYTESDIKYLIEEIEKCIN